MHIQARRIFRLSITTALSLAIAYALKVPLPFIAPLFAVILCAAPSPPIGLKALLGLVLVMLLTMGIGLLLIPMLLNYQFTAFVVVAVGIYLSFYLTVNAGKALLGLFLTIGITLIPAAGTVHFSLATTVIEALVSGVILAVISQWLVYPWFPEDTASPEKPAINKSECNWIAIRGTIIILPVFFLILVNPTMYLPLMMKSVTIAQQSSLVNVRSAGRELLGSTLLAGVFAILLWMALGIFTHLWMYFLLILLFGIYFASKIYQVFPTRFPASFWINVAVTVFILLGPAVEDTNSGKDVYAAFFVRMSLFIFIAMYAVITVKVLEWLNSKLRKENTMRHLSAETG
jgi:hypothetical protein